MKPIRLLVALLIFCFTLSACGEKKAAPDVLKPDLGFQRDDSGWSLRVRFDRPVAKPDQVGQEAGAETILVVSPPREGKVTWTAADELRFTPADSNPPTETLSFELVQVAGEKGAVRSPKPGAWRLTVDPDRLALTQTSLDLDYPAGEGKLTLNFNLAPDLESLKQNLSLSLGDESLAAEVSKTSDFGAAVIFKLPRLDRAATLKLRLADGTRTADGKAAAAAGTSREFELRPPELIITNVEYQTGGSGYYFSVSCTDRSMPRDQSYLCEIPDEELAKVKVTPGRNPSLAPDQNGFRIFGEFSRGTYAIEIPAGFRSRTGGILKENERHEVTVPARPPRVRFTSQGRYLPRKRLSSIPVSYVNVKEITVTVREVPEQNLVFWFSGRREDADERTAEQIASRQLLVKEVEDRETPLMLDLSGMVPEGGRGLYEISLSAPEIENTYSRLILTDLALIAKRTGPEGSDLMVWALNAETLAPVPGARIEVRTKSNRLIASATADETGLVKIPAVAAKDAPAPYAVLARTDTDFTGLKFSDLELQLAEFPVSGEPYRRAAAYRAALWSDRGAYRPGDQGHLVSALWEDAGRAPEQAVPVVGKLIDPRGKEAARFSGTTNPAGLVAFDHLFPDFAATGKYQFVLEVGGVETGRESFYVEEFMPERVKVTVKPKAEQTAVTSPAAFDLSASYLFGAVARGEPFEAECSIEPAEFKPKKLADYFFGVHRPGDPPPIPLGKAQGKLSDEGRAEFSCPGMSNYLEMKGPARVRARVAVLEAGSGRTSTSEASVPVHPDEHYIGLKASSREAAPNQRVTVSGVIVGWDGEPVNGSVTVELEAALVETEEIWRYNSALGRSEWQNFTRRLRAKTQEVSAVNGRFSFSFDTGDWGEGYLVSARVGRKALTELYLPMSGGYYWCYECDDYYGGSGTPKPSSPDTLVIDAPKAVETGETAKARIDAPFPGRLLFSVETDQVLSYRWVEVLKAGPVELEFSVPEFTPNVYLSALMIKDPFSQSKQAFMPARAFGVVPVRVNPTTDELKVKLTAPAEMRPNRELTVKIDAGPNGGRTFATIAAVDEGVLQLTRFVSPDPLSEIYAQRALGVNTFETVGWSLILPAVDQATGGDAGDEMDNAATGRPQPVKPVALWSGVVELDKNGRGQVTFKVPSYQGELRVMAVAAGIERIGAAETRVKVRDPLALTASFPRFLVRGDGMVAPVFVQNLTGTEQKVTVKVTSTPELEFTGSTEETLTLKPEESGVAVFTGKANAARGAAQVKISAKSSTEESSAEATVPMQPDAPVIRERQYIELKPGDNDLTSLFKGWTPGYEETVITISGRRFLDQLGHASWLIRYPYGCIEQTSSSTRPLLYIRNLIPAIDPRILADGSVEDKFMSGIRRLLSMQTYDGGFAYWPGEERNTLWGTANVTYLLLEAIDAGYPVPVERKDEALDFIERTLTDNPERVDTYGDSVPMAEPYMQFVLARAGRGRAKRVQELIASPNPKWGALKTENLYLLKAALYLMGDRTWESELKNPSATIAAGRQNDWTFWSANRSAGLILNIAEELFPGSNGLEPLSRALAEQLGNPDSARYTTQELSWGVSALGKRAGGLGTEWAVPTLMVDGRAVTADPLVGETKDKGKGGREISFQPAGVASSKKVVLKVDWIKGGKLYALVSVAGVKQNGVHLSADNSLEVRRAYRKLDGSPVKLDEVGLGEVVFVELSVKNPTGGRILNVAVVDRFGGGLEVENPRLNREHLAPWVEQGKLWSMDYMNIRDDRIELFGALEPGEVKFVYALRATVPGTFAVPPIRAEAMYDPMIWSQALGAPVTVVAPWKKL